MILHRPKEPFFPSIPIIEHNIFFFWFDDETYGIWSEKKKSGSLGCAQFRHSKAIEFNKVWRVICFRKFGKLQSIEMSWEY